MGMMTFTRMRQAQNEEGKGDEKSLEKMTVNELKAYAKANDISLEGAKTKADILGVIMQAQNEEGKGDGDA